METVTLNASRRDKIGTKHSRRLRESGKLPAIIYGHGEDPEAIVLPGHEVEVELLHGARVLEVSLEGKTKKFLIKDVQYDYLGTTPIHLDLMRVDLDETVTVRVGIELKGTPKGVSDGGVLDQHLADIEVECLMTNIPDTLTPLVIHLGVGESLLVGDLDLPPGVKALAGADERVASVSMLAEEVEEEEAPAEEEEAQPEVISKGKKEEGEGGPAEGEGKQ
jgi:large subunit ribosomal protein L25